MKKKYYYFCETHMTFSTGCQIVGIGAGDNIASVARLWGKTNGYKHVYVYDMHHNLVWDYDINE